MSIATIAREVKERVRPYYLKWLYARLTPQRYPSYFRDCWSYPIAAPSRPGEKGDVLFLPAADIHTRTQRSEHLAATFAERGFRCFYLNPHLGREFPQPHRFSNGVAVTEICPRFYEIHVHLPREPVYHHRCLLPTENTLIADSLSAIFQDFQVQRLAIVSSFPLWLEVAAKLRPVRKCPVLYDCHDLWGAFGNIAEEILADEAKFFDLSDRVLFSAETLMSSITRRNPGLEAKSTLVRNAAGPTWFEMERAPGPKGGIVTVGYIGSMSPWVDFDMIESAATRHPEWNFVLIGREESPECAKLARLENVYMPGEVPYAELPRYLAEFNVAIIPFRLTPLTQMTNPIKLYEYLACGLPVVSSALPEVAEFSDLVYIAKDPQEFVVKLEQALCEPQTLEALRREAVRGESWTKRCQQIEPFLSISPTQPASPLAIQTGAK